MKKYLLFTIILFPLFANAQLLLNPGFEQWIFVGGWFENPEYWQTNNNQIMNPVTKDQAHNTEGQFAMSVGMNGWARYRRIVPADFAGFLFDWYFTSVSNDTALVIMYGYDNGIMNGSDTAEYYINGSGSSGAIAFPNFTLIVDSFDIIVEGGHNQNTYLILDNFREIITDVGETQTESNEIRYDIENEKLIVSTPYNFELIIYDTQGRMVLYTQKNLVDITAFTKGLYIAHLISCGNNHQLKFLKK